jgi:hypothetical protein
MYTTLYTYTLVPGAGAALKRRIQMELEPLIRRLPGLIDYYLLEGGTDQLVSISIFDSKGKAEMADGPMGFWVRCLRAALGDCILGQPAIVSGQTEISSRVEALAS